MAASVQPMAKVREMVLLTLMPMSLAAPIPVGPLIMATRRFSFSPLSWASGVGVTSAVGVGSGVGVGVSLGPQPVNSPATQAAAQNNAIHFFMVSSSLTSLSIIPPVLPVKPRTHFPPAA